MKTSELQGAALDWAVAKCEGWTITTVSDKKGQYLWLVYGINEMKLSQYRPSTNWMRGGPIIEREKIDTYYGEKGWWQAVAETNDVFAFGSTPLIAAMRCYVASKLGDEVELPEELTNE
jgi:hypothetical protein